MNKREIQDQVFLVLSPAIYFIQYQQRVKVDFFAAENFSITEMV